MEGRHLSTTVAEARLKQLQSDDPIAWQERCSKCSWLGESGDIGGLIFRRQAKHVFACACGSLILANGSIRHLVYIYMFSLVWVWLVVIVAACSGWLHRTAHWERRLHCGWSRQDALNTSRAMVEAVKVGRVPLPSTAKTRLLLRDSSGPALS